MGRENKTKERNDLNIFTNRSRARRKKLQRSKFINHVTQWHKDIYQKGQAHKEITMNISLSIWLGEKNDECLSLSKNQK